MLVFKFLESDGGAVNEIDVLRLADRLLNHTQENVYLNPIDIATVIDMLAILVKTQVGNQASFHTSHPFIGCIITTLELVRERGQ